MIEKIGDALDPRCINLELKGRKKPEIIRELVTMMEAAGKISDAAAVESAILAREALTTTGIGGGIAIPHCLTSDVNETFLGVGRSRRPVKFDSVDRKPVQLFFVMVGPEGGHTEHLRLLSKLARYLHDTRLKRDLMQADAPAEVVALFLAKEDA